MIQSMSLEQIRQEGNPKFVMKLPQSGRVHPQKDIPSQGQQFDHHINFHFVLGSFLEKVSQDSLGL